MIDTHDLPSGKHEREYYLKGMKQAVMELAQEVSDENYNSSNEISGAIWNKIEEIDKLMEG